MLSRKPPRRPQVLVPAPTSHSKSAVGIFFITFRRENVDPLAGSRFIFSSYWSRPPRTPHLVSRILIVFRVRDSTSETQYERPANFETPRGGKGGAGLAADGIGPTEAWGSYGYSAVGS